MIRVLVLSLLFVLGLAAAALWQGQMHHLRRAVPDRLPDWTGSLDDRAGLRRGTAVRPAAGILPPLTLGWQARAPSAGGLVWDVSLTAEGADFGAEMVVPWQGSPLRFQNGNGTLDLDRTFRGIGITGLVVLESFAAEVTEAGSEPQIAGRATGQARSVGLDEVALGSGPVEAALDADGGWHAEVRLDGGATAVGGTLSGRIGSPVADLEMTFADPDALPAALRRQLESVGSTGPEGLTVRLSLPVGG